MNLNFAIPIFRHCTYFETKISNQAAELVVHCTRVVGVKSLGKMRGMTRLMDLLFFDKGRIDKKKIKYNAHALYVPLPLYELPPPSAAPSLLIDFTMHQVL